MDDVTVRDTRRTGTVEIRIAPAVVTETTEVQVVEVPDDVVVVTGPIQHTVEIISVGIQGPPGPPGSGGGGGGDKFSQTIGDGVSTDFPAVHNFNTRDAQVEVYRATAPFDRVFPDVEHTDVNTVTVKFSPAPALNQFRVVVMA